jgi:ElaB/YqjD/DUF883 family membrane-anchored ribosome-binding protein
MSQYSSNNSSNASSSKETTDHAGKLASELSDAGQHLMTNVKERVSDAKDRAMDAKDMVVSRGETMIAALAKVIKDRPLTAVASAFGIGYLVTRLARR